MRHKLAQPGRAGYGINRLASAVGATRISASSSTGIPACAPIRNRRQRAIKLSPEQRHLLPRPVAPASCALSASRWYSRAGSFALWVTALPVTQKIPTDAFVPLAPPDPRKSLVRALESVPARCLTLRPSSPATASTKTQSARNDVKCARTHETTCNNYPSAPTANPCPPPSTTHHPASQIPPATSPASPSKSPDNNHDRAP